MKQKISNEMALPIVLHGRIVHGQGLGRTVGMPTANLCVEGQKLPMPGVYATRIRLGEKVFGSVTNIGNRPTVDDDCEVTVETFILDFEGDIYGETVELEVLRFLRPIQKFSCLEEVWAQVQKDIEEAKKS